MFRRLLILLTAAAALAPAMASAAEPPNHHDPCARGGRDSCSTTGVGAYKTYRYGLRWFGDYRGAISGVDGPTFCLDLRFWYPGRSYDFRASSAEDLHNRAGDPISSDDLRRMSYAIWSFGRTRNPANQGAVMLYVHKLMGDGAPGEVDSSAAGGAVRAVYDRIARDAPRYAGPYKIQLGLPATLPVRRKATLTVRVLASSGAVVPNVRLGLKSSGASGLETTVDTGSDGVAHPQFTPTDATNGMRVTASSGQMAALAPRIYVPARKDAARNGQRLAVPASAAVSATVSATVKPAQLTVATIPAPATPLAGQQSRDTVTIGGAYHGWRGQVAVHLYGPFRSQAAISCLGAPVASTSYQPGSGPSTTPALTVPAPGWYAYQLAILGTGDIAGLTTKCPDATESFMAGAQPTLGTQISAQSSLAGDAVTDSVAVGGLFGESVSVAAMLYGPYPSADKVTCAGVPFWTGGFTATADGTYVTAPVTLTVPGYYTYVESIPAGDFTRPAAAPCAGATETTVVRGRPAIKTQVSAQEAAPGVAITDSVAVSGLGALSATANVALYGPFASRDEIRCDGAPVSVTTLAVTGDGSYTSQPTTLSKAGFYTFQESLAATPAYEGATTACADTAETTFVRAQPVVTTVVSNAVVRPGSSISDRIKVVGLGQTPATVEVRLYGPFASLAATHCDGTALWKGSVNVNGDGQFTSAKVQLTRAGFYTYREHIAGTVTVVDAQTACADVTETSLASPLILTGRGDRVTRVAGPVVGSPPGAPAGSAIATGTPASQTGSAAAVAAASGARASQTGSATATATAAAAATGSTPTRVRIAKLGIDAPIYSVDIDTHAGALAIPQDIDKVGWWRDGGAPGSAKGAILLAGHVDSAARGAGAFYALKSARRGDTVTVTSADGKARNYRITSQRRVLKAALPASIFSRTGPRRLVLVTCGGPFDAKIGHYRDNIIVTALPR